MQKRKEGDFCRMGRFLSLVLRHKPSAANITLDKNGWANVDELLSGVNSSGRSLDLELLEKIVKENNKKRYVFNEDHSKIRACQGHSLEVDVGLTEMIPPLSLYHGTAVKFLKCIEKDGLLKQNRLNVHLSDKISTALSVGKRHGKPVVLLIDTAAMLNDGFKFYLSENNVWLCDYVPWKYITVLPNCS